MRQALFIIAVAVAALLRVTVGFCEVPGEIVLWGDDRDKPATNSKSYSPTTADIQINGAVFFEIRTPATGYSVAQRECITLKRVVEIFSSGKISPVYVDAVRGCPTIYVGKYRLISVYPEDVASYHAVSAYNLAEQWAEGTRKGIQRTAPSWCVAGRVTYPVAIGGALFFRLESADGYADARERGRAVDARLAEMAPTFDPALVSTQPSPTGVAVTYKGSVVVNATVEDARAEGSGSPELLANAWAENLRKLLPLVREADPPPAGQ